MSIRILKYLNTNYSDYQSLGSLLNYFTTIFDMEKDIELHLNNLIEHKLVEAEIKVDSYIEEIKNIKITAFGKYFLDSLIHFFTYLDLVCTDCDYYDEQVANFIARSSNEEYDLFTHGKRGVRLIRRIEKTNTFMTYLIQQEKEEIDFFDIPQELQIMREIKELYLRDLEALKTSALRQRYSDYYESKTVKDFFEKMDI